MAKFEGHTGPVAGMSFSENGYYLATCAADGVKLWDLRKLKNFRTLAPPEDAAATTSVHFDKCGPLRQAGRPASDLRSFWLQLSRPTSSLSPAAAHGATLCVRVY